MELGKPNVILPFVHSTFHNVIIKFYPFYRSVNETEKTRWNGKCVNINIGHSIVGYGWSYKVFCTLMDLNK